MWPMAAEAFIQCRVIASTKQALRTVVERQQLTESALLKRLIDFTVQGVAEPLALPAPAPAPPNRYKVLSVRQVLLSCLRLPRSF